MTRRDPVASGMTLFRWAVLLLALAMGALELGCGSDSQDAQGGGTPQVHSEGDHEDPLVSLTAAEIEEFELRVAPAGRATIEWSIELPGVVRANEDRLAHIVPRFAGIVTEVRKRIGDTVKSGETLALVESSRSLSPYALKTLLDGVIIEKHVTRGEAVTPDSQAFVVANLETVPGSWRATISPSPWGSSPT